MYDKEKKTKTQTNTVWKVSLEKKNIINIVGEKFMSLNQLNQPQHQSYTSHVIDHLPWQRHTLTETVSLFRKTTTLEEHMA